MADQATRPAIRTLFIQTVFSLFLGIVVFSVLTYAFVVPELVGQATRIQVLESQVAALQDQLAEDDAEEEDAPSDDVAADEQAAAPSGSPDGGTSASLGTP